MEPRNQTWSWIAIRAVNVAIGGWILASAFLWRHNPVERANAVGVGIGCALTALAAIVYHPARYLNAALGVWLFSSWAILPVAEMGTVYLDWVFGISMMLVALAAPPEALPGTNVIHQPAHG